MGCNDRFVDSEIIVTGWAEQGFEGRHYFRSMRLCKEGFTTIVQAKVESHSKNIDPFLLGKLIELRKSPSFPLFEEIMKLDAFKDTLYQQRVLNLKWP